MFYPFGVNLVWNTHRARVAQGSVTFTAAFDVFLHNGSKTQREVARKKVQNSFPEVTGPLEPLGCILLP